MEISLVQSAVFKLTFWWFGRILVREGHGQLEMASIPYGVRFARNTNVPDLDVHHSR